MNATFRSFAFVTILIAALTWNVPGQAQSSSDLNNRLQRLENDVQTLSRTVYKGEDPPPGAFAIDSAQAANTEVRIQQLENDLRTLTGKLEEQSYQTRQVQEQLDKALADMELRLKDLESGRAPAGMTTGTTGSAPQYTSPDEPPMVSGSDTGSFQYSTSGANGYASPDVGEQLGTYKEKPSGTVTSGADQAAADYENAFALLKAGNYDSAERGFDAFLKQYPDHVLAPNAKYWYGESFYVRGQFDQAARVFAEAYQMDPNGSKSADNLLKMGMSLAGLGKKDDACLALGQLNKTPTPASSPVMRRAEQEMARIGC